ncbi:Dicer-like protein, partial [Thalictrum thalictroides]
MAVEEEKKSSIKQIKIENDNVGEVECSSSAENNVNDGRIEVERIENDNVDEVECSSSEEQHESFTSSSTDISLETNSTSDQEEEKSLSDQNNIKDPRIIARKYQLELCKKAVEENIIVYLGTGCGKTHIAVLLIHELGHLIRKPQKSVCVFLAPTIPLVQQQASVIEEFTDFKVGSYYGHSKCSTNHQEWEKELEKFEVLVMTPQILLHNLLHRLIKMELIALLIFDECHHAQAQSSHPYAQIMKEYNMNSTKRPRVFGMTASPIVGKGGDGPDNVPRGINSLEKVLNAKVYTVEDNSEVEGFVASPQVKCYYYDPISDCSFHKVYLGKLEEIKNQCIEALRRTTCDVKVLRNSTKLLQRLQDNLLYCLENLGLWGAVQ